MISLLLSIGLHAAPDSASWLARCAEALGDASTTIENLSVGRPLDHSRELSALSARFMTDARDAVVPREFFRPTVDLLPRTGEWLSSGHYREPRIFMPNGLFHLIVLRDHNGDAWITRVFPARPDETAFRLFLRGFYNPPAPALNRLGQIRRGVTFAELIDGYGRQIDHVRGHHRVNGWDILARTEVPRVIGLAEVTMRQGRVERFAAAPFEPPGFTQPGLFANEGPSSYLNVLRSLAAAGLEFWPEEQARIEAMISK